MFHVGHDLGEPFPVPPHNVCDYEVRSSLGLVIHTPEVFADQAEEEQLYACEERDGNDKAVNP